MYGKKIDTGVSDEDSKDEKKQKMRQAVAKQCGVSEGDVTLRPDNKIEVRFPNGIKGVVGEWS